MYLYRSFTISGVCFVRKSLFVFNGKKFRWKISGQIPEVNIRISDMRLFQIMNHLQSFSFPQSKKTNDEEIQTWTTTTTIQQTLETIDSLIDEKEVEMNSDELIQIEANFELSKVRIIGDSDFPQ